MTTLNSKNNMELWNQVCVTNPSNTKAVTFGRKFTAIDAYSQIQTGTKLWGGYGDTWGLKDIQYTHLFELNVCDYNATFWYPKSSEPGIASFPVNTCIDTHQWSKAKNKLIFDADYAKKAVTDMLTKSLSFLGFSADVFLGKFDDNRYVQEATNHFAKQEAAPTTQPIAAIDPALEKAISRYTLEIFNIKKAITEKNTDTLSKLWHSISVEDQRTLWTPEAKFGPFSDAQRNYINRIRQTAKQSDIANQPNTVAA